MNEFKNNLRVDSVKPVKVESAKDAIYVCGICGKPYSTIEDRMACEKKCYDERKAAEEALREQKLAKERDARKAEIEAKYKEHCELGEELSELIRGFIKDYGYLQLRNSLTFNEKDFPFGFDKIFGGWF